LRFSCHYRFRSSDIVAMGRRFKGALS